MELRQTAAVAVGGVTGATLRWAIAETINGSVGLPWGILVANTLGCLILGGVVGRLGVQAITERVGVAVGVGFCGALTTFSTFALDLAQFLDDGRLGRAAAYLAVSVVVGTAAFLTGRRVGAPTAGVST